MCETHLQRLFFYIQAFFSSFAWICFWKVVISPFYSLYQIVISSVLTYFLWYFWKSIWKSLQRLFLIESNWKTFYYSQRSLKDRVRNSCFYIEKWTFKVMCEVCYRAKRDKKEATRFKTLKVSISSVKWCFFTRYGRKVEFSRI